MLPSGAPCRRHRRGSATSLVNVGDEHVLDVGQQRSPRRGGGRTQEPGENAQEQAIKPWVAGAGVEGPLRLMYSTNVPDTFIGAAPDSAAVEGTAPAIAWLTFKMIYEHPYR